MWVNNNTSPIVPEQTPAADEGIVIAPDLTVDMYQLYYGSISVGD